MSVLSDVTIGREVGYGDLGIDPYDEDSLGPASYDVHTAEEFIFVSEHGKWIDLDSGEFWGYDPDDGDDWQAVEEKAVFIPPNDMILARTKEYISIPDNMTASVEPRSSAARLGLFTDGWIDPGFEGHVTLELANTTAIPLLIRADSSYCQLVFEYTKEPAKTPYGDNPKSRYQGQTGVTPSEGTDRD